MNHYLLDTNTVSFAVTGRSPTVLRRISECEPSQLRISAVSYGEIWFGLFRRPEATRLRRVASHFLSAIDVLPWTAETANSYARLRAEMERSGKTLSALDMLIAAHALEIGAALVSSDRAFRFVPKLTVEDWLDG